MEDNNGNDSEAMDNNQKCTEDNNEATGNKDDDMAKEDNNEDTGHNEDNNGATGNNDKCIEHNIVDTEKKEDNNVDTGNNDKCTEDDNMAKEDNGVATGDNDEANGNKDNNNEATGSNEKCKEDNNEATGSNEKCKEDNNEATGSNEKCKENNNGAEGISDDNNNRNCSIDNNPDHVMRIFLSLVAGMKRADEIVSSLSNGEEAVKYRTFFHDQIPHLELLTQLYQTYVSLSEAEQYVIIHHVSQGVINSYPNGGQSSSVYINNRLPFYLIQAFQQWSADQESEGAIGFDHRSVHQDILEFEMYMYNTITLLEIAMQGVGGHMMVRPGERRDSPCQSLDPPSPPPDAPCPPRPPRNQRPPPGFPSKAPPGQQANREPIELSTFQRALEQVNEQQRIDNLTKSKTLSNLLNIGNEDDARVQVSPTLSPPTTPPVPDAVGEEVVLTTSSPSDDIQERQEDKVVEDKEDEGESPSSNGSSLSLATVSPLQDEEEAPLQDEEEEIPDESSGLKKPKYPRLDE